jgi:hypothetical protein
MWLLCSLVGEVIGIEAFPATAAGYRQLLERAGGWARCGGPEWRGPAPSGRPLSRSPLAQGVEVLDVDRPDRTDRRRCGKWDPLDAQNAARAVLSGRARAQAKSGGGPVRIARMYKLAKGSAVKARPRAINQLKAVLGSADPNLREELAGLSNAELLRTCARLAEDSKNDEDGEEAVLQATRITLCLPAQRIGQLTEQIHDLEGRLARLVERHAPRLLTVVGIGPDTAVTLLITIGTTRNACAVRRPSPRCAGSAPSSVPRAAGSTVASTVTATGRPTPPCTASCSPGCAATRAPRTTTNAAARRARPDATSSDASNATLPGRPSTWSGPHSHNPRQRGSRDT